MPVTAFRNPALTPREVRFGATRAGIPEAVFAVIASVMIATLPVITPVSVEVAY